MSDFWAGYLLFMLKLLGIPLAAFIAFCFVSRRLDRGRPIFKKAIELLRGDSEEWWVQEGDSFRPCVYHHRLMTIEIKFFMASVDGARAGIGWSASIVKAALILERRKNKIAKLEALIRTSEGLLSKEAFKPRDPR